MPLTDRHRAVAFAAQRVLEEVVLGYLRFARRLVGLRTLCLAGGVALNGVANRLVVESAEFDEVYVQPAAGDAGTSIGAALLRDRDLGTTTRAAMRNAFLGPDHPEAVVTEALAGLRPEEHHVERTADPAAAAARLLAQDAIIGWFQGRAEFGPRALGARSILAAAGDAGVMERINARIKRRELFRPLAPAILDTAAEEYFAIAPGGRHVYPFMLATAQALPRAESHTPAVVHVDGSARVQTVSAHDNPLFARLLQEFAALTGVPVVLNTSFNDAEEPIVGSPRDAVRTYRDSRLDALVIGPYVVRNLRGDRAPGRLST